MENFIKSIEDLFMHGSINTARRSIDECLKDDIFYYNVDTLLLASQIYLGVNFSAALRFASSAYECSLDDTDIYESLSYKSAIYAFIGGKIETDVKQFSRSNDVMAGELEEELKSALKNYESSRNCLLEMLDYNSKDRDVLSDSRQVNKCIRRVKLKLVKLN